MRLLELFDTKGIVWIDKTHARFEVNGQQFLAWFKQDIGGGSYYEFQFAHETADPSQESGSKGTFSNTGLVGPGASKVFGYAVQCVEEFLKANHPGSVGFRGQKADGRDTLYMRMMPVLAKRIESIGYTISSKEKGPGYRSAGGVDFTLKRNYTPAYMPPKPEPREQPEPLTPEEWDDIEAMLNGS